MNNFTAHDINILKKDGSTVLTTIPPCGYEIRLAATPTKVRSVKLFEEYGKIPIRGKAQYTGIEFFKKGVKCTDKEAVLAWELLDKSQVIIVSTLSANYMKEECIDLGLIISPSTEPSDTVRDATGKILGIKALQE